MDDQNLDPEWLQVEQQMGGRMSLPVEAVDKARQTFNTVFQGLIPLLPPPTDAVHATDVQVPQTSQTIRVYKPTGSRGAGAGPLPVGLYIHSGGWYSGSIEHEDFLCRNVAEHSNIILFSPEYRLAPEHPFPSGLEDVCAAYEFMHHTASTYGGDNKRKFIMGGSAGGNLTLALGLKYCKGAARSQELKPSGILAFCTPTCEPTVLPERYKGSSQPVAGRYANTPMINEAILRQARDWYGAPPADGLYSVLLHPDIKHLPRCYLGAPTEDPTFPELRDFASECQAQGVNVGFREWENLPHFFWVLPQLSKSREFMDAWNSELIRMIADC